MKIKIFKQSEKMINTQTRKKNIKIIKTILKQALNNLDILFDFENITEEEFKKIYGYNKQEIKGVLK